MKEFTFCAGTLGWNECNMSVSFENLTWNQLVFNEKKNRTVATRTTDLRLEEQETVDDKNFCLHLKEQLKR